ncbi:Uncharacterized protein FWK35_00021609 [Aphis craccivora]|uniref:RNA-directed DNA polymerase from mobile element jockey n=1 Tax=Aphis craccivora TaxID=307492 RepID=A0A6G0YEV2_APHCR|nr:Uncharacterized protein FWK35_00021609 [Aphis craccivora]
MSCAVKESTPFDRGLSSGYFPSLNNYRKLYSEQMINWYLYRGSDIIRQLFLDLTEYVPVSPNYVDDKAIISINHDPVIASHHLQNHFSLMEDWYTNWRLKINQSKSIHCTFTLRQSLCPAVSIYGTVIPNSQTVKYLGLMLDRRLTWAQHIKSKRLNLNSRLRLLKTFLKLKFTINDSTIALLLAATL